MKSVELSVLALAYLVLPTFVSAQTTTQADPQAAPPAAPAQTPAPTPAPDAAAAPPASTWSVGPIDFSGMVDGYYSYNENHPASGANNFYNFNVKANQFSLNMAKLTMSHTPDPVGFQVDFGFGKAFDIFHATEPGKSEIYQHLEQVYVSLKPKQLKGLEMDFGEFVTSAGAELTETYLNYNYSRSLIYANGPYYHFGLRTSMPVNKYFTAGFQVVNGWNNFEDNNSGKTIGLTGTLNLGKVTWANTWYYGPEKNNTNFGKRNFYDTVLNVNPNSKLNTYLNFDYGREKQLAGNDAVWVALAGAAQYWVKPWFAISPRLEWYNDHIGFITGTAQALKEFTLTGEFKMAQGFLTRLEYRHDWSNQPVYDHGNEPASVKSMDTLSVGLVAFFGPKR